VLFLDFGQSLNIVAGYLCLQDLLHIRWAFINNSTFMITEQHSFRIHLAGLHEDRNGKDLVMLLA
jgi:hypothetical protein